MDAEQIMELMKNNEKLMIDKRRLQFKYIEQQVQVKDFGDVKYVNVTAKVAKVVNQIYQFQNYCVLFSFNI